MIVNEQYFNVLCLVRTYMHTYMQTHSFLHVHTYLCRYIRIRMCMCILRAYTVLYLYVDWYTALIAQLEAGCVDDSAKMKDLQETVKRLQLGLRELETERDSLLSAHKSTSKEHESAVQFLSEELQRLKREKEDLVVQYGREIEAAQAQLSTREQELGAQHLKALQDSHSRVESLQVCLYARLTYTHACVIYVRTYVHTYVYVRYF